VAVSSAVVTRFVDAVAVAVGGEARVIPTDHGAAWAVVMPSGAMPVLIVDYGHLVRVSILKVVSWDWTPEQTPEVLLGELAVASKTWLAEHPDRVSLTELAVDLADHLGREFGNVWDVSIPGTVDPSEMWLHPPHRGTAAVGIFDQRAVIWLGDKATTLSVRNRGLLPSVREKTVAAVERQIAHYERHVALSEQIRAAANTLCSALGWSTVAPQGRYAMVTRGDSSYESTIECRITWNNGGADFVVARLFGGDNRVNLTAGVEGPLGWTGHIDRTEELTQSLADQIAKAFIVELTTLTVDKIAVGHRYRVLETIQGLVKGALVTFVGLDDIDNHYGSFDFTDDTGDKVSVTGDFSSSGGPLREAYRYLVEEK